MNQHFAGFGDTSRFWSRRRSGIRWTIIFGLKVEYRWYPLYLLSVYTGQRQGELLGIHRGDIDRDNGVLRVRLQISPIRGKGLVVSEPETEKARRPVTLPPSARNVLVAYLLACGDEPGLIFTASTGNPKSPRNLLRHFRKVISERNFSEIRFHDLQHTHATL